MRIGDLSYRLIGLLLAITTLCPSWIAGPCCCTQKAVANQSAAACCSRTAKAPAVTSIKFKKPCCAARAVVAASVEADQSIAVRPVSTCRCRLHLNAAAVTSLVRPVEPTMPLCGLPIADSRLELSLASLQTDPKGAVAAEPGEPPDPAERCALLCRWLA